VVWWGNGEWGVGRGRGRAYLAPRVMMSWMVWIGIFIRCTVSCEACCWGGGGADRHVHTGVISNRPYPPHRLGVDSDLASKGRAQGTAPEEGRGGGIGGTGYRGRRLTMEAA
jgi:hypothetical protein